VLDCASRLPDHLRAVVLVSPPGNLGGLTPLELQIRGMPMEGWPHRRVAAALVIPDRAVRYGRHVPPAPSQI
jgi:pimeloyl-ACP methyl ester carboxylesterase